MGGKNSMLSNPLGSVGKSLGIGPGTFVGDALRFMSPGVLANEALTKWVPEAVGHVTGANAQRKALMDQQSAAADEAKRMSQAADAQARNASTDPTNIFLGDGSRRRRGGSGGPGGSSGTQTSTGTGTQNF